MRRRGFALIASLMLCIILFALGTGLLSKESAQYQASLLTLQAVQARALAQAGLSDALAKISRDPDFPPLATDDQRVFAYAESVIDSNGATVGSYQVKVDRTLHLKPWRILIITSQGRVGNSRYSLRGELDISPTLRSDDHLPNPDLLQWTQVEDLGGL